MPRLRAHRHVRRDILRFAAILFLFLTVRLFNRKNPSEDGKRGLKRKICCLGEEYERKYKTADV